MDASHIFCVVMALLAVVMETESCMCMPRTFQDYYCDADFAVKATVSNWTAESDSPSAMSTYTLHIIKVYKLPSIFANETEIQVNSMASDGLCGINPGRSYFLGGEPDTTRYFITGSLTEEGTLWSQLCRNTYRSWRWMSKNEKKMIRKMKNLTC